jgi:predicted kinase
LSPLLRINREQLGRQLNLSSELTDAPTALASALQLGLRTSVSKNIGRLVVLTGLPGSGKTTLATQLAASLPACRMCHDDWMMASGIDLWDEATRARIEAFQADLSLELLRAGQNVVIEWGLWAREERDALRNACQMIGAQVELHYLTAEVDELWRRVVKRDLEGRWGSRSIRRHELDAWARQYQPPTDDEFRTHDNHAIHDTCRQ